MWIRATTIPLARRRNASLPCPSAASRLREPYCPTTSPRMISRDQFRRFMDHPIVEWTLFVVGILLLAVSPLVGVIPGPGGIVVAGLGLALILKTSMWAKRHYARLKKRRIKLRGRHVVLGDWADWALRRGSAKRRREIAKAREVSGN